MLLAPKTIKNGMGALGLKKTTGACRNKGDGAQE